MNEKRNLFLGFLLAILFAALLAQSVSGYEEDFADRYFKIIDESNNSINVFYSTGCGACEITVPKIKELSKNYPEITINYFNIYQSNENRTILLGFGDKYGVEYPPVPVIYTGNITVLEGGSEIDDNIEIVFEALRSGKMPDIQFETEMVSGENNKKTSENQTAVSSPDDKNEISYIMIILAGLADGINPCALSVLALLLVTLTNLKSQRRIILNGMAYTTAVFLFYLLAGLGIVSVIQATGLSYAFTIIAGLVALSAGIISVIDAVWNKSLVNLGIPESGKTRIKNVIEKASLPAAFVLGVLVGIFELPCTGGIYIAVLGLLSSEMTFYEGLPYLIIYNLMFIVPLILIILAVAFGLSPERVDQWRDSNKKMLKGGIGLILIIMGAYILTQYLM